MKHETPQLRLPPLDRHVLVFVPSHCRRAWNVLLLNMLDAKYVKCATNVGCSTRIIFSPRTALMPSYKIYGGFAIFRFEQFFRPVLRNPGYSKFNFIHVCSYMFIYALCMYTHIRIYTCIHSLNTTVSYRKRDSAWPFVCVWGGLNMLTQN